MFKKITLLYTRTYINLQTNDFIIYQESFGETIGNLKMKQWDVIISLLYAKSLLLSASRFKFKRADYSAKMTVAQLK